MGSWLYSDGCCIYLEHADGCTVQHNNSGSKRESKQLPVFGSDVSALELSDGVANNGSERESKQLPVFGSDVSALELSDGVANNGSERESKQLPVFRPDVCALELSDCIANSVSNGGSYTRAIEFSHCSDLPTNWRMV